MIEMKYYECYKTHKEIERIRAEMVKYAREYGIKEASGKFATTEKTVRKWVKRYRKRESLKDRSRRPKSSPNRIKVQYEKMIIDSCLYHLKHYKRINGVYLKNALMIPYSVKTVIKVMRGNGLYERVSKKKPERKRDLREIKKLMKVFEKLQVDVKYLTDIPEMIREMFQYDLPRFQYTARCVRSGTLYYCYANRYSVRHSVAFMMVLLNHLKENGIDIKGIVFQTDNGPEFTNHWKKTDFVRYIEWMGAVHYAIPPGAKTYQSDVETSHRLIEDEFYSRERFFSRDDFFEKTAEYQRFFNEDRLNRYKGNAPLEIFKENCADKNSKVLVLRPVFLDDLLPEADNIITSLPKPVENDTMSG